MNEKCVIIVEQNMEDGHRIFDCILDDEVMESSDADKRIENAKLNDKLAGFYYHYHKVFVNIA